MKSAIELLDEYSDNLVGADTYGRGRWLSYLHDKVKYQERKVKK